MGVSGSKLVASVSQPNLTSILPEQAEEGTLFGLNIIHCKKDSSVRRGATIKAISILSKYGELIGSNVIGSGLVPIIRKIMLEFFGVSGKKSAKKVFRDVFLAVNQSVDLSRYLNAVDLLPNLKYSTAPLFQVLFFYFIIFNFNITSLLILLYYFNHIFIIKIIIIILIIII